MDHQTIESYETWNTIVDLSNDSGAVPEDQAIQVEYKASLKYGFLRRLSPRIRARPVFAVGTLPCTGELTDGMRGEESR